MRDALYELLAQSGYRAIAQAIDPVEAVEQALHVPPDIIVLDSAWTEIQGMCLSRMLRVVAPQSKIVLLVDGEWLGDKEAARSSGADALVHKSTLTQDLALVLSKWQTYSECA